MLVHDIVTIDCDILLCCYPCFDNSHNMLPILERVPKNSTSILESKAERSIVKQPGFSIKRSLEDIIREQINYYLNPENRKTR